ncbi:MAG TPA: hypothetical protein VJQ59_05035 [Candidatus Sulfotelmatobacter sp.]|nr:hypothetical protein [Candidatus Sulfotelmatobacter sp.]
METHRTLEDARIAAKAVPGIHCIVEIDHATEDRCFIKVKAPMKSLELTLKAKPMPEIRRLIAEHAVRTEAEIAADREQYLREHTHCERCRKQIDGNTAYSQQEWFGKMKVVAFYCDSCRTLLSAIGAGEFTELQERSTARHSTEPYTKEDF